MNHHIRFHMRKITHPKHVTSNKNNLNYCGCWNEKWLETKFVALHLNKCSVFVFCGSFVTIISIPHWQWQTTPFNTLETHIRCFCPWITSTLFHTVLAAQFEDVSPAATELQNVFVFFKSAIIGHSSWGCSAFHTTFSIKPSSTNNLRLIQSASSRVLPTYNCLRQIPRVTESLIHLLPPVHFPASMICYHCVHWSVRSPLSHKTTLFDLACKHPNKMTAPCWQEAASELK